MQSGTGLLITILSGMQKDLGIKERKGKRRKFPY